MLFGTLQFAIFLGALLLGLAVLPRRAWSATLLGASLLFYGLWIPAYLPLLLVDIGVSYALLGRIRGAAPGSSAGRRWLIASVAFSLGLLLYFKYAVFLLESALPLFAGLLSEDFRPPEILLPLGISFYTFQIISLAVDTHADTQTGRGADPGRRVDGLAQYALYICFFPQLIAGPILRGGEMLPQLRAGARPSSTRAREGIWLLARGLGKKIVLADFLLAPFVERIFEMPGVANRSHHWVALYAFSFQIYFDFSGYTDMARGIGKLIGFELPENFLEPLLSRNPAELWRRWHVTLSRWLRDYLYIPLGGNRGGAARTHLNLMATMVLGGLWHGASWSFVLWGALQGAYLVAHRLLTRHASRDAPLAWRDAPRVFVMFQLWSLGWVLFRTNDLDAAEAYLQRLVIDNDLAGLPSFEIGLLAIFAGLHVAEHLWRARGDAIADFLSRRAWGLPLEALLLGVISGIVVMAAGAGAEFIYFQF